MKMTDEVLVLVGEIVTLSGAIENRLTNVIATAVAPRDHRNMVAGLVAGDSLSAKVDRLRLITDPRSPRGDARQEPGPYVRDGAVRDAIVRMVPVLRSAVEKRNLIVHGEWLRRPEGRDLSTRRVRGRVSVQKTVTDWTVADLVEIRDELATIEGELVTLWAESMTMWTDLADQHPSPIDDIGTRPRPGVPPPGSDPVR